METLQFLLVIFTQIHKDLIFNTARRIGRQFDAVGGVKGIDCLHQTDRADGDQVFGSHLGIIKFLGDIDDQTQVMGDQGWLCHPYPDDPA